MSLGAAAVLAGVAALYVVIMRDQGDHPAAWFLGSLLALTALAAAAALADRSRTRLVVVGLTATAATALGIVAIFSVGVPILVAAGLLWLAATRVT